METRNNDYDPDKGLLSDIVDEALHFTPTNDPDEPRDPAWLRWLKFGSWILVPAILFAGAFAFENYLEQFNARNDYQRHRAERRVEHDSIGEMKFRLFLGAGVGAGLGGIYVVRCLVRKVDP